MKFNKAVAVCAVLLGLSMIGKAQNFLTNGLVAYYPFNGNANDTCGNGDNGTVLGASLGIDRFGNTNSAYEFDYTAPDSIQTKGLKLERGRVSCSFSIWFRQSKRIVGDFIHAPLVSIIDPNSSQVFVADFWGTSLEIYKEDFVGYKAFDNPQQPMIDGKWHQLVSVVTPDNITAFIDGVRVVWVSQPPPGTQWSLPEGDLWIGYGVSAYFDGALDDFRVYDYALSAEEVGQLYFVESQPKPWLTMRVKTVEVTLHVTPTKKYQLQASFDLKTWTNVGEAFVAPASEVVQSLNAVEIGRFFKLNEVQ